MAKFGFERLAEDLAEQICAECSSWANDLNQRQCFGSPIETILWLAICWYVKSFAMGEIPFSDVRIKHLDNEDALVIEHQKVIVDWPVDFLIYPNTYPDMAIVVDQTAGGA